MSTRPVSYGKCFLCGGTFAKNTITRHLKACLPAHETAGEGKPVRLFHIQVEGKYAPEYWLHLEIPASDTLADLDDFLRAIWLECCDHLSGFIIKGVQYEWDTGMVDSIWSNIFGPSEPPQDMNRKLYAVLSPGDTFIHEYDYGTTTTLKLKVVGERKGIPPEEGIRVLARNYAPPILCSRCKEPAAYIYVHDYPPKAYCETHAEKHKKWDEGFLPIVNSPRVGQCGYSGPADEDLMFEETAPESDR